MIFVVVKVNLISGQLDNDKKMLVEKLIHNAYNEGYAEGHYDGCFEAVFLDQGDL